MAREEHVSEDGTPSPSSRTPAAPVREPRSTSAPPAGAYPSWQPGFYPAGLDRSGFLSYYAERLATVELNATKYRLPSEEQFRSWAAQVPDGFRFAVKAPDGIERRLATFEERVRASATASAACASSSSGPGTTGFLELLLGSVDPGIRYALDLRDPSWDGVEERLAEAGMVRVGDRDGPRRLGLSPLPRAPLRRRGARADRRRTRELARLGTETFAFFRHGDAPDAPAAAAVVATACALE